MAVQPEQVQRKRKRQSDPAYVLVRRSLYYRDGIIHLKTYCEATQTNIDDVSSLPVISVPAVPSLNDGSNKAQRPLVGPIRLQHLRDTSCLDEFKTVFAQAVRCHRVVYMKTGDLHRNLSPNKIMFTRSDHGAPLGFLHDWDLAKCISADEPSSSPSPSISSRHRAGEAPFMAYELLRKEPPLHLYRHDLESFMYTLIWCALHFNLNGFEAPGINEAAERWTYGTWEDIRCAKACLFLSSDCEDEVLHAITPEFGPFERGVRELIYMFDDGYTARKDRDKRLGRLRWDGNDQTPDAWDEDTLNGHVTYEKFMSVVGENYLAELEGSQAVG